MEPAALFVCRKSFLVEILGAENCWDRERNALTFPVDRPGIYAPPCRAHSAMRHHAKPEQGEKELAYWAVDSVRMGGGVLEHPYRSTLFQTLPPPGQRDFYGGRTVLVEQVHWGHKCRKRTLLYIVGNDSPLPPPPFPDAKPTAAIGSWARERAGIKTNTLSKLDTERYPRPFAEMLVELARGCGAGTGLGA